MNERQALEDLLKDAEAFVAKIRARLAEQQPGDGAAVQDQASDASTAAAIDLVQSQKTSDDTGNY